MSALPWIERKRDGGELTGREIAAFVAGVTSGAIPDYQVTAWLMAVYLHGLTDAETALLTEAMIASGERLDWSGLPGKRVDKHSTGGVGDKISLILAPAVAACGAQVPMISGRSLGHTGGTLDKLESIPGFRVNLSTAELKAQVADLGVAFGAATDDLAPADRKLYALRDATGTVASIPLITSSILSKKVAEGIDGLVLDVKTGSGAFMTDVRAARRLAETLVNTGKRLGVETVAWITNMSAPLGRAIGNALEVSESIDVLQGLGPKDLVDLTVALGGEMLVLGGIERSLDAGRERVRAALRDGSALERFRRVVECQGGDASVIERRDRLAAARRREPVRADRAGYIAGLQARALGEAAVLLGAGRRQVSDRVDPAAGIVVLRRVGDPVAEGDAVLELHCDDPARLDAAQARLAGAIAIGDEPPRPAPPLLHRLPSAEGN